MKKLFLFLICLVATAMSIWGKTGREIIEELGLPSQVEPLVSTHWSQLFGENSLCPVVDNNGTHAVAGCGPVALAQIIRFWSDYVLPRGLNYYSWTWGKDAGYSVDECILSADISSRVYDWDNMLDIYYPQDNSRTTEIAAVSRLMADAGILLQVNYTDSGTATQIEYMPAILNNFFGFKSEMRILRQGYSKYSDEDWLAMVYTELSQGRPIIMGGTSASGSNHIFIADGYNEDGLVHLNLGYANPEEANFGRRNNKDKYYDLTDRTQAYNGELRMIIGISPNEQEVETYTFHNESANALIPALSAQTDAAKICSLKVSGKIGPSDLNGLRELCAITTGQLSYIDLSDCTLNGDFSGFANSLTLQRIILPSNCKTINSNTFKNCRCLRKITFPDGLESIGSNVFTECRYLQDITLPSTLISISPEAFGNAKVESIAIADGNQSYRVENDAIISISGNRLISVPTKVIGDYEIPYGVNSIERGAFNERLLMTGLAIPECVQEIADCAVINCAGLQNVYCRAPQPPSVSSQSFQGCGNNATLHVPYGSRDAYLNAGWTMFNNIIEDNENTNIISPTVDIFTSQFYNLQGIPVATPKSGNIYIQKISDGSCRKVIY